MLLQILSLAASSLWHFTLFFILVMLAFSSFAYVAFGPALGSFSTFISTVESLLAGFMGARMYRDLELANTLIGRIFYFIFVTVMLFCVTNLLIGTLTDAIHTVQQDSKKDKYRHRFFNFVAQRLKDILGIDEIPWIGSKGEYWLSHVRTVQGRIQGGFWGVYNPPHSFISKFPGWHAPGPS